MAALFTAASTQYLVNSGPRVLDYPLCVGMWANLTAVGTVARTLWALSDTGTADNYLSIRMNSTEAVSIVARAAGTEAVANAGTMVAGRWSFIIGWFSSSTLRRLAHITPDGVFNNANSTTARAPAGMDTTTLGALSTSGGITEPWDGMIGEFWIANKIPVDMASGADEHSVRALALGGPFALPSLADGLVEYRSFRTDPVAGSLEDVFHGFEQQQWVNTNGVTTSHHPPLPYWYRKPKQVPLLHRLVKSQIVFQGGVAAAGQPTMRRWGGIPGMGGGIGRSW